MSALVRPALPSFSKNTVSLKRISYPWKLISLNIWSQFLNLHHSPRSDHLGPPAGRILLDMFGQSPPLSLKFLLSNFLSTGWFHTPTCSPVLLLWLSALTLLHGIFEIEPSSVLHSLSPYCNIASIKSVFITSASVRLWVFWYCYKTYFAPLENKIIIINNKNEIKYYFSWGQIHISHSENTTSFLTYT